MDRSAWSWANKEAAIKHVCVSVVQVERGGASHARVHKGHHWSAPGCWASSSRWRYGETDCQLTVNCTHFSSISKTTCSWMYDWNKIDFLLQVTCILSWSENTRSHFRLKARVILERLIRKCGYDVVASFVPEKHKKLVVHIRKMNERQKKKKLSKMEDSSRERGSHTKRSSRPRYMYILFMNGCKWAWRWSWLFGYAD